MTTKPQTALTKTNLATECPEVEIVSTNDPVKLAASMPDEELLTHLKTQLGGLQCKIEENRPYLLEAHARFSQLGRRTPIRGFPSWSEWVRIELHVHIRTAQRCISKPNNQPVAEDILRLADSLADDNATNDDELRRVNYRNRVSIRMR
jgi:hypothetical protein